VLIGHGSVLVCVTNIFYITSRRRAGRECTACRIRCCLTVVCTVVTVRALLQKAIQDQV
jgi:hypothetical protein